MQRLPSSAIALAFVALGAIATEPVRAADARFTAFVASLWPEAQQAGVSRATFDKATLGLEPDYKLPDLVLPGKRPSAASPQAEFVQVPADYLREASIARLAEYGQSLRQQYRSVLDRIEKQYGVPATVILAIWGRETDYGRYTLAVTLILWIEIVNENGSADLAVEMHDGAAAGLVIALYAVDPVVADRGGRVVDLE